MSFDTMERNASRLNCGFENHLKPDFEQGVCPLHGDDKTLQKCSKNIQQYAMQNSLY
jgi:hypothetical protein